MKQNIGMVNSLIRITCGFTMLAFATARLAKRPHRESYLIVAMLGAMKVAEGMVRFCPITYLFNEYQTGQTHVNGDRGQEQEAFINPS
ncbi:DUF2892 domain-containing protein [Bacillus salitolerans]|uniref:DUF2892 domain-containing protein n=1 Tax=Bacillus salitolerans TaxID=1437434 RepID=A0ABW4LRX8_9BACI